MVSPTRLAFPGIACPGVQASGGAGFYRFLRLSRAEEERWQAGLHHSLTERFSIRLKLASLIHGAPKLPYDLGTKRSLASGLSIT